MNRGRYLSLVLGKTECSFCLHIEIILQRLLEALQFLNDIIVVHIHIGRRE